MSLDTRYQWQQPPTVSAPTLIAIVRTKLMASTAARKNFRILSHLLCRTDRAGAQGSEKTGIDAQSDGTLANLTG